MGIAQRIHDTIEDWRKEWGDILKGWMTSWLTNGVIGSIDFIEPEAIESVRDLVIQLRDDPNTPADLRNLLDKAITPGKPLPLLLVIPIAVLLFIPTLTSIFQPLGDIIRYKQERVFKSARFDPTAVITAWRRDPVKYERLFSDLKDQGWSDDSIEALKFITLFYPSAQDLVTWLAREVFEPEMIDRYGLDDEAPTARAGDFEKAGVSSEQMMNFWRAHWEHASFIQVVEMLHRGLLSLSKETPEPPTTKAGWEARDEEGTEAMYEWYRLVEIPPFWRDKLTAMAWNVPTRVDVRRFWDMRTIDEERLRSIYHAQGYHGKDLDDYVRWTKVYTDFPMKMTHFTNGWITEQDIRDWLKSLEIPEDRIEDFIKEKTKPAKPERVADDKKLTMALIVEGVKKGVISEAEGIELLMDLGYDEAEADYIIRVRVETATGSPETVEEFRDITQGWRRAVGKPAKDVSPELKRAASEVVRLTKERDDLARAVEEERRTIADEEEAVPEVTKRLKELRVALHRAEAELHRVRTDYDALVAEWKQQEAK